MIKPRKPKYITEGFKKLKAETIESIRQEMIEKYPSFVHSPETAQARIDKIVKGLIQYFTKSNINTVVLGMSGGLDSAVTAALCRKAGVNVIGLVMPIEQKPNETLAGLQAAQRFCTAYTVIDLTNEFKVLSEKLTTSRKWVTTKDHRWTSGPSHDRANINLGNIKARLRMITLYDEARKRAGVVISTDNYSELLMGFWTICGDVGDVSPIQMVFKGFELPWIARKLDVPESIVNAVPTDGLGISKSDEEQLDGAYDFVDAVMCNHLGYVNNRDVLKQTNIDALNIFSDKDSGSDIWDLTRAADRIVSRFRRTEFKRNHPHLIEDEGELFGQRGN